MNTSVSLTGRRFGRLTVISRAGSIGRSSAWECVCDCGGSGTWRSDSLKSGNTTSCGCVQKESAASLLRTHGLSNSPEYRIWHDMLDRCNNPNDDAYEDYGARGIRVCERWRNFRNFYEDMGRRPSDDHSLDREDNDGDYEPNNCRWATRREQSNNRRNTVFISIFGEKEQPLSRIAEEFGISYDSLYSAYHYYKNQSRNFQSTIEEFIKKRKTR